MEAMSHGPSFRTETLQGKVLLMGHSGFEPARELIGPAQQASTEQPHEHYSLSVVAQKKKKKTTHSLSSTLGPVGGDEACARGRPNGSSDSSPSAAPSRATSATTFLRLAQRFQPAAHMPLLDFVSVSKSISNLQRYRRGRAEQITVLCFKWLSLVTHTYQQVW